MSDEIKDADGLYYPYINIRDDTWLKTSLPYFPHVVRMVPANYETGATGLMRTLATTRSSVPYPTWKKFCVVSAIRRRLRIGLRPI